MNGLEYIAEEMRRCKDGKARFCKMVGAELMARV